MTSPRDPSGGLVLIDELSVAIYAAADLTAGQARRLQRDLGRELARVANILQRDRGPRVVVRVSGSDRQ